MSSESVPAEAPVRRRRRVPWWVRVPVWMFVLLVALRVFEYRALFHPTSEWDPGVGVPAEAEEVRFESSDGVSLSGLWVPADGRARGVIVYCHGNAGNLSHRIPMVEGWREAGYHVFLFDYRGYGKSDGWPSEKGLRRDARAALTVARARAGELPIIVYGRSIGTVPAVRLAAEQPVDALVLDSPPASTAHMAQAVLPIPGLHYLLGSELDNHTWIQKIHCPLLVLHGRGDDTIPLAQGKAVFDAAPEPKRFVELRGAGHNQRRGDSGDAEILEFLEGLQITPR